MSRSLGVTNTLRDILPEWTIDVFAALSWLGDLVLIVPVLALLYVTDVLSTLRRGKRDRALCADRTALLIAAVFGGLALVVLVKGLFALPRPPEELHAITASEYGFPSGHAMAATVFWGALALWTTAGNRTSRFLIAGSLIAMVGASRLALGVHYLVDVLASVAFGATYLAAIAWLAQGRPERAFGIAIAIAAVATAVTGGSGRALLALLGTIGATVGWWAVETPRIRGWLVGLLGRAS